MGNKAVIIGAGVGGMTLAIYLKRAGVNFILKYLEENFLVRFLNRLKNLILII